MCLHHVQDGKDLHPFGDRPRITYCDIIDRYVNLCYKSLSFSREVSKFTSESQAWQWQMSLIIHL